MTVMETAPAAARQIPLVKGWPVVGNVLEMAKDPARFFARAYQEHGPVYRIKLFNRTYPVLAGADAANFMGSREGRECLRSKEFWQGFLDEYGGTRTILGEDGDSHKELRDIMRRGYSRDAIKGRADELVAITDRALERDWRPGKPVPVVHALQYMVTDQLGTILTGNAPLEYVPDIRTMTLYVLNVLVTRQRPKILLRHPKYRRARARVFELGDRMVAELRATAGSTPEQERNLVEDLMDVHLNREGVLPANDLTMALTGPYVAGLDTVANTTAAFIYSVLKHPEVLAKVRAEADALFAGGSITDDDLRRIPSIRYALMEAMRLYPIAVALTRTATRDFEFGGYTIKEGEMVYVATTVPHFLDEYFPDPDTFDIGRYEKPRSEHLRPGAYSPYGRGPHTCLGKSFADVQMALSMARLFHRLDLELDPPGYTLVTKTAPTPGPAMSFKVKVKGYRH
ncbi:cytochrome P450 [Dactylosporangium aurantiacum]|uniref:Cytochrome P450 n=1 Tax=Dactylosporangium aurantiacum TaxID=35754 RepID=A0A9Q9IF59_9ACTN|nr:cytochrome P450 [Dactylosporangium aurantiacum]MDG6103412.1 cytochrome P450 [Dactylosporangium aurantiacum]UWZ52078.1 cytochrome P450 [Dactylosporangium aurantiacum]